MNSREILIVFLGIWTLAQVVRADPTVSSGQPENKRFQDLTGPDISQSSWPTPAASLPSSDASNSIAASPFDSTNLATTLAGGKPVRTEQTKSIEVETTATTDTVTDQPPAVTVTASKGGPNKMVLIGGGCLVLLAFRIFRRPGNVPKKPRFL